MKLFKPPVVVESTLQLGYPESAIAGIGVVLGAVLLTGHLGGAVATHVRVAGPWFNILFPVAFGCLVWGGLWLRDRCCRAAPLFQPRPNESGPPLAAPGIVARTEQAVITGLCRGAGPR